MTLNRVLLHRTPGQPWANGGGTTRVLLAWPLPASWQVRVSVAEVTRDGPFSALPGIERWFAVVSGAGVALQFPEGRRTARAGGPPLRFDGARAPGCALLDGPTQDLNLMIPRQAGSGDMQVVVPDEEWKSPAPWRALYAADAMWLEIVGQAAQRVDAGTLAWSAATDGRGWRAWPLDRRVHRAWWLEFTPAADAGHGSTRQI